MAWFLGVLLAAVLGWSGARLALAYGRRRRLLDQPGDRRSHAEPTVRGGGVGIVVAVLVVLAGLYWLGLLGLHRALGVAGGLVLVAVSGWWDDHRPLPIGVRLAFHTAAGAWLLFQIGGVPALHLGFAVVSLGPLSWIVPLLAILWLTNLFNFMDGIDALAAMESVFAGVVFGAWFWLAGEPAAAAIAWTLAAACLGFLPFNRPPARLFLGDVGSTSLGFVFAALSVYGETSGSLPALAAVVILGVFVIDATCTLTARGLRGRRWYTAHREHAYQYLVRAQYSHGQVVARLMLVNAIAVLPAAAVGYCLPDWQLAVTTVVVAVGCWLWKRTRSMCHNNPEFT